MKVKIAGYNIEAISPMQFVSTPEVITAAYARVSRSDKTIDTLRKEAREDVERARKSNASIVYEMGHASIAEHAFFNIDIENISRLALEEIEKHRLASYTERSQRYVKLDSEWHLPEEWDDYYLRLSYLYQQAIKLYQDMIQSGIAYENARYYLPLMVTSQVGLSCNARTAEHLILRCLASPLAEVRNLGKQLHQALSNVTPSLIRYVEPSNWCQREEGLHFSTSELNSRNPDNVYAGDIGVGTLDLCSEPKDWDTWILAAQEVRKGASFASKVKEVQQWSQQKREEAFFDMVKGMSVHDPAPRSWEHVHITFELVLSAAAYAQLKRHRICDLEASRYNPALGFTHPATTMTSWEKWERPARELVRLSEDIAEYVQGPACAYAFLLGHRRRVLWTANFRELVHFSRLREDSHAQWDIRAFAHAISRIIQKYAPLCGRLLGGKDSMKKMLTF